MGEQPKNQKVEQAWETPSYDEIPAISKQHAAGMEVSNDDAVWNVAGMDHALLYTTGRKSGTEHKVALPVWLDKNNERIVVASYAGHEKSPSWFHNLADKTANPQIKVRVQNGLFWSDAEVLDGDDYTETWAGLTADRAWYNDYQAKTSRRIPLIRLPETRPAD